MQIIDKETIVGTLDEFSEIVRTGRLLNAKGNDNLKIVTDEGYLSIEKINAFKAYRESKYKPGQRPPSDDEQPSDIINH